MGDTFGGEHHRPRSDGRGHSQRQLQDRASYDNEPAVGYSGCLLIALILAIAATVSGLALT
jgi:hypothetical protein